MIDMKSSGRVDGLRGDVEEVCGFDGCRRKVGAGARGIADIPDGIMKLAHHGVIDLGRVGPTVEEVAALCEQVVALLGGSSKGVVS